MKKNLIILIVTAILYSCTPYLDYGKNIHTDYIDFNYLENYNEFIYKSKINSIADKEIYYTTHFSINIPKEIKNWESSGNTFYFEYGSKEIIYINTGYKNKQEVGGWTLREANNDEIYNMLSSYWNKKKYNENTLKKRGLKRVSKVYFDGRVSILLYNIKQENLDDYLGLIKKFKYLTQ